MTRRLVIGNWKMNGVAAQLEEVRGLAAALAGQDGPRVVVCPPATLLHRCALAVQGSAIEIGAQDVNPEPHGARTGDLSAEMLHDAGAEWVILGHSERRSSHRESDSMVRRKAQAACRAGLRPVVCVGETADDREAGKERVVVRAQVDGSCPDEMAGAEFAIAYEPVWAIGTGRIPTLEQISAIHDEIASVLRDRFGSQCMAPILYGGSVTSENSEAILSAAGVSGVLVGGASLTARTFLPIVRAAARA